MDSENLIAWTVPNWVTIGLMGMLWFGLIGFGMSIWKKRQAAQS